MQMLLVGKKTNLVMTITPYYLGFVAFFFFFFLEKIWVLLLIVNMNVTQNSFIFDLVYTLYYFAGPHIPNGIPP